MTSSEEPKHRDEDTQHPVGSSPHSQAGARASVAEAEGDDVGGYDDTGHDDTGHDDTGHDDTGPSDHSHADHSHADGGYDDEEAYDHFSEFDPSAFVIGAVDYPHDRERYRQEFDAVELRVTMTTPPTGKILRRWAREAGDDFVHVMVAWQSFTHEPDDIRGGQQAEMLDGERAARLGHFKDTSENRRVWGLVKEQAEAIGANLIVLEMPASFSPSPANKERVRRFVKGWGELGELKLGFQSAGFWTREETLELTSELGILPVIDPLVDLEEPLPQSETVYFRMLGRNGLRTSYGDEELEVIAAMLEQYNSGYVFFRTDKATSDAKRLRMMIGQVDVETD